MGVARVTQSFGYLAHLEGDPARAITFYQDAVRQFRALGDRDGLADALHGLGQSLHAMQDLAAAHARLSMSLMLFEEVGSRVGIGMTLNSLGELAFERADLPEARRLQLEALGILEDLGDRRRIALVLDSLAAVSVALGRYRRAVRLAGSAAALRELLGIPATWDCQTRLDRRLEVAVSRLADHDRTAAWAEGQSWSVEQAVAYARGDNHQVRSRSVTSAVRRSNLCILTTREREIVFLLAHGDSNRQIADKLVIGVRTVETHVEHILRKLELNNRGQVSAWVHNMHQCEHPCPHPKTAVLAS